MDRLSLSGSPFPFGLTYVPSDALGPVAGDTSDPARAIAAACASLQASFAFVPAEASWAEAAVAALVADDIAPLWAVSGPLWPVIDGRGVLEGLRATLTHPTEIGEELDSALEALMFEIHRGVSLGARAIVLAEDLAGSEGPLVAPDFAIAELLPRYERIVDAARASGLPAILHSDGDIRPLLPAVKRAGFVAVHAGGGLSLDAFDHLFWAARAEDLAVIGGMLTAEVANPARAVALGSRIGVLAQAGGLFVADDGGLTTEREVAGLVTALGAARAI